MKSLSKSAWAVACVAGLAAPSALAAAVAPGIEGTYNLTVTCPTGAGASICRSDSGPLALVVMDVDGEAQVSIASSEYQITQYLFSIPVSGADLTTLAGGPQTSRLTPASIQLSPGHGGQLIGSLEDPSAPGSITLTATPVMTLASCEQTAAVWSSAGPQVTGSYTGMVNTPDGATGTLLVQQGGDGGHGLTAAFSSDWATPLYFETVTVGGTATLSLTHLPDRGVWGDQPIKWCLASTDAHQWTGWAYGLNGYVAPLAFTRQ